MSLAAAQASATRAQLRTGSGSASFFSRGIRVGSGAKIPKIAARRTVAPRAVATPPREDAARNRESSGQESETRHGSILGPNDAPSPRCGARRAEVPYFGSPSDRAVLVNDAARDAIRAADATSFIALPEADDPNLVALKDAMQKRWQKCEPMGSGSASAWPELFDAGAELIRATICADARWPADAVEILPGTGWLSNDDDASAENASDGARNHGTDQNIDWVIRRPEGHVVSSKIHFATRLHRDPDSWTNPKTPQRPKDGWTDLAMPERGKYAYRFINVWVARSAIDPTLQVWQSPLVVCLPRDGGRREWAFERQTLEMSDEEAEKEFAVRGVDPLDIKTWIPGVNRLFRPLWNKQEQEQESVARDDDVSIEAEATSFEFPELTPSDAHVFVSAPALVFDSFDLWHGAATWSDDDDAKKTLRAVDTKGRQPFHRARCSVEARFRVRVDVERARASLRGEEKKDVAVDSVSPWGPFAAAVASGKFRHDGLRDSEARYDLEKGDAA